MLVYLAGLAVTGDLFRIADARPCQHPAQNRVKKFERLGRVIGIKAILIVIVTKINRILVPGIVFIHLAGVTIATAVMRVVIHLKHAVMLDDPVNFGGDERA